jgi:hypothetical protein
MAWPVYWPSMCMEWLGTVWSGYDLVFTFSSLGMCWCMVDCSRTGLCWTSTWLCMGSQWIGLVTACMGFVWTVCAWAVLGFAGIALSCALHGLVMAWTRLVMSYAGMD